MTVAREIQGDIVDLDAGRLESSRRVTEVRIVRRERLETTDTLGQQFKGIGRATHQVGLREERALEQRLGMGESPALQLQALHLAVMQVELGERRQLKTQVVLTRRLIDVPV